MTEQEFRQKLDVVVTEGLNTLGAGVVYGQLATMKQFVEVVYDSTVVNYLQSSQMKAAQEAEAASQGAKVE
jgi:hypothetical protein